MARHIAAPGWRHRHDRPVRRCSRQRGARRPCARSLATGGEEGEAQQPLADEGFQLLGVDRRGYGRSPSAEGEDFLRDAEHIAALMDGGSPHDWDARGRALHTRSRHNATRRCMGLVRRGRCRWSDWEPSTGAQARGTRAIVGARPRDFSPAVLAVYETQRWNRESVRAIPGVRYRRSRTVSRARSTPHCSSGVRWP
jgi:hypothetical protein